MAIQATLDFEHLKGDTFNECLFEMLIEESSVYVPINITDAVIRMQLRKEAGQPVALSLTSVSNQGITITNGPLGLFKINEQVIDIPAKSYEYDIEIEFPTGKILTYVRGNFNVINDITRQ